MRNSITQHVISQFEDEGFKVIRVIRNVRPSVKQRYSTTRLEVDGYLCSLHHIRYMTSTDDVHGIVRVKVSRKTLRAVKFVVVRFDIEEHCRHTIVIPSFEFWRKGVVSFYVDFLGGFA